MFQLAAGSPPAPIGTQPFHQWVFPDGTLWTSFFRTEGGYLLRFPCLAEFAVDDEGRQVRAWPAPGVDHATVRHLYLNQVQPLAWSKQGKLVLHGSAVEIEGQGVAFIGPSGYGKSTLAASFATSGSSFLSDDGLVIEESATGYMIVPHHPSIRLWQDSRAALINPQVAPAPPVQYTNKARFLAGDAVAFCAQPRELRRVYFLAAQGAREPAFTRMKPADALVELVKNSFMLDTDEAATLSSNFDLLSRLVSLPVYFRLDYPRSYRSLPGVRAAIAWHIAQECEPA